MACLMDNELKGLGSWWDVTTRSGGQGSVAKGINNAQRLHSEKTIKTRRYSSSYGSRIGYHVSGCPPAEKHDA